MRQPVSKFAIVLLAAIFTVKAASPGRDFFDAGEKAARLGDSLRAYVLFAKAAQLEPLNTAFAARKHALETSVALTQRPVSVPVPTLSNANSAAADSAIDRGTDATEALAIANGELDALQPALQPVRLAASPGVRSFQMRADVQTAWNQVSAAFGIHVEFDRVYQPVPGALHFDLTDVEMPQALRALELATDSFVIAIGEHQIMVARDTPDRRAELTPTVSMAVPIPERLSVQEAQELLTAVQQIIEIRRVSLDPSKRVAYFRDVQGKAIAARKMFLDLSQPRAQVEVEVEVLSFSRTSNLAYGLSLPTSSALIDFGVLPTNLKIPTPPSGVGFASFGGGASTIGLGIAQAKALATIAKASSQSLLSSTLVAADGQPTTLHIGDRYPIITSSLSGSDKASNAEAAAIAPAIQFVDLGLSLKITPTVHEGSEVTLDIDSSYKTLGALVANNIPAIASQELQGKIRLKEGEWAVIAGMLSTNDSINPTGVAGASQIPLLGNLFRSQTKVREVDQTLIILKPRLVILPAWETVIKPMWTGTETRPVSTF